MKFYVFDDSGVPAEHMRRGMKDYIERGVRPGEFAQAILANDFVQAAAHADMINKGLLFEWASWLFNDAPAGCWGSKEKVEAWIKACGMRGKIAKE